MTNTTFKPEKLNTDALMAAAIKERTIDNLANILTIGAAKQIALEKLRSKALAKLIPKAPEHDPEAWIKTVFPNVRLVDFGDRHQELWNWAFDIEPRKRKEPFVGIWPRGSGKSTTAELVTTYLGATGKRFYGWYISSTQALADLHVESIGALIESQIFSEYYPKMANRQIGKFGNVRGWRRNRLRASNGFTIDALGLDTGARGSKIEEQRPDFIILDDIDEVTDSEAITLKKIKTITTSILPAGSSDVTVLAIQNLILNDGFFGKLANKKADYLTDAIISGPYPAIYGLQTEQLNGRFIIVDGQASWQGQDLETCQQQIDTWGYTAFLREAQHIIKEEGSLFSHINFQRIEPSKVPDLVRKICVVDPAVTSTDNSDSHGINISGIDGDGRIYHIFSFEKVVSPKESLEIAIRESIKNKVETLFVEVNQGGNLWQYLYNEIVAEMEVEELAPTFQELKVTSSDGSKIERANGMLADYEKGNIFHVKGTHDVLETALARFPIRKPYDLVDASVHCHRELKSTIWGLF